MLVSLLSVFLLEVEGLYMVHVGEGERAGVSVHEHALLVCMNPCVNYPIMYRFTPKFV